jgi:hypothetical protein
VIAVLLKQAEVVHRQVQELRHLASCFNGEKGRKAPQLQLIPEEMNAGAAEIASGRRRSQGRPVTAEALRPLDSSAGSSSSSRAKPTPYSGRWTWSPS